MLTIGQPGEHPNRRPRWKAEKVPTQKRIMSEKQDKDSVRISQVLAGALAAITAAVLGSTMGVAGTVIGAGLASVVSTVGGAIYLRSIQRTRQGVRTVRAKVVGRNGTTSVLVADLEEKPEPQEEEPGAGEETETQPPTERRLRWPVLVAGSVLAFALGMLVITGIEWVRGEPLSGGNGTTVGDVFRPPAQDQQQDEDRAPETSSSTPPPTSTDPTSTPTTPPPTSSTTSSTTTTTTGSSTTTTTTGSSTTTTTTTPPPG